MTYHTEQAAALGTDSASADADIGKTRRSNRTTIERTGTIRRNILM
jgi:hypothetical protein